MGEGGKEGKCGCYCYSSVMYVYIFLMVGLDVVAGFVAMQAEVAQQEVKTRVWLLECKSPSKKAFVLGLIALGCLLSAHSIAVMIGYIISNLNKVTFFEFKTKKRIHMACIFLTWIVATAGAGILAMGIWMNRESRSECGFENKNFLSLGGKVCFLHAIVSVVMYVADVIPFIFF